jgi:DNA-binding NarL/FixJ family response regulator
LRAPIILIRGDRDLLGALADELKAAGWAVRDGFDVPADAWDLKRLVCVGALRDSDDAQAIVLAAARGAGVVVALQAPEPAIASLYEDLTRLGHVEIRDPADAPVSPLASLEPEQRRMVGMLGAGASLDEIAAELSYSRRTVSRRLGEIRDRLDVATNTELAVLSSHLKRDV